LRVSLGVVFVALAEAICLPLEEELPAFHVVIRVFIIVQRSTPHQKGLGRRTPLLNINANALTLVTTHMLYA